MPVRITKPRDVYGGRSPREIPAYTVHEASRYLQIPFRTVHNWAFGYALPGDRRAKALIEVADPTAHQFSFVNMLELHVLDSIRHVHGISMPTIRRALEYVQDGLGVPHPLIDQQMLTDGKNLFVERLSALVDVGRDGQLSILAFLDVHLDRIERDPSGIARKLFLFTRSKERTVEAARAAPRTVSIDPGVAFGRPVIAGSRIPTVEVAERYKAGDSIARLVAEYDRRPEEIEEAIRTELQLEAA